MADIPKLVAMMSEQAAKLTPAPVQTNAAAIPPTPAPEVIPPQSAARRTRQTAPPPEF